MVWNIAHRGSSSMAPENTVAAVTLAVEQSASFVEVDVRRSADDSLVIMHDATLTRTTNVTDIFPDRAPWNVADFTLSELKRLDAGSWFGPAFTGDPIPTLVDVIDALGQDTGLLLEIKTAGVERTVHRVLSSHRSYLRAALRDHKIVVQSFDVAAMRSFHFIAPDVPIGLLYGPDKPPTTTELVEASTWARQVNISYRIATKELVTRIHGLGMTVSVYTVDDPDHIETYVDLGVDGVVTNRPSILKDREAWRGSQPSYM